MEADRLANCMICGKLFIKTSFGSCSNCRGEIERDFRNVAGYLKGADAETITLQEVSEATSVPLKRVTDFIRDGRIYGADFPNLGYPCAHCGITINRQTLCYSCYEEFSSDLNRTLKRETLAEEMYKKRDEESTKVKYWQLK